MSNHKDMRLRNNFAYGLYNHVGGPTVNNIY